MLGIEPTHIIVVVVVALLIFGPDRLPQIARDLTRTIYQLRQSTQDMSAGFGEELRGHQETPVKTVQPPQAAPDPALLPPMAPQIIAPPAHPAQAVVTCPQCHVANPAGSVFCNACGTKIVGN